jgi:hypothetical protein
MKTLIRQTASTMAICAIALAGVSAGTVMLTADAAYAKSDNGNGGGNGGGHGGGNGGGNSGKGNSGHDKSARGGGADKGGRGNGKGISGFVSNLFGKERAAAKRTARAEQTGSTKLAPAASVAPAKRNLRAGMHPSQLGSMNGALNANINAVLAHIRNGNTNGPVGALAALAVADHNAVGAQELLDLATAFETLDGALATAGYETIDDYYAALDGMDPIEDIELALADVEAEAEGADEALAGALEANGYGSLEEYQADLAGADNDAAVDEAIAALGGDASTMTGITEEAPTEEELADAEAALEAQETAEGGILDAWNKSGEATEEEQAGLMEALRDRLEADSDAIADTIGAMEEAAAEEVTADAGTTEPATEEELAVVTE